MGESLHFCSQFLCRLCSLRFVGGFFLGVSSITLFANLRLMARGSDVNYDIYIVITEVRSVPIKS